jgi:D-threo-aldose 1-dehydrogenase
VLRNKKRDTFVLSTKVGRLLEPDPDGPTDQFGFVAPLGNKFRWDYSADGARRSVEESLLRLGLDRIDIVFIHDVSEDWHGPAWLDICAEALAGAAVALTKMREEGLIRAWGLGVNFEEPCLMALDRADPDLFLLAGRYSLLRNTALDRLFPACAERDVKIVIGGPYNSGLLAGGNTFDYQKAPPDMIDKARRIRAACDAVGIDIKAAALQFCAAHPVVASVIPGARTPHEVRQNVALMQAQIPLELWAALHDEGLLPEAAPTP